MDIYNLKNMNAKQVYLLQYAITLRTLLLSPICLIPPNIDIALFLSIFPLIS